MIGRTWLYTLLAAAVVGACSDDSDPIGPRPGGIYTAAVTGGVTASLTGSALFGADMNDDGDMIFAIALGDSTSDHVVILARKGTTRPVPGTYTLVNALDSGAVDGWTALHIVGNGDELAEMFLGTSGELVITESSADRLKGTFGYAGRGIPGTVPSAEPVTITVQGTFDAAPATGASLSVARLR
jgi:hypothetical protein